MASRRKSAGASSKGRSASASAPRGQADADAPLPASAANGITNAMEEDEMRPAAASSTTSTIPLPSIEILDSLDREFQRATKEAVNSFAGTGKASGKSAGAAAARAQREVLASVLETLRQAAFAEAKKHVKVDSSMAAAAFRGVSSAGKGSKGGKAGSSAEHAELGMEPAGEAEALALQEPVDQDLAKRVVALEKEHAALVKEVKILRGQGASQVLASVSDAYDARLTSAADSAAPMLTRSARALMQQQQHKSFPLAPENKDSLGLASAGFGSEGGGRRASRGGGARAAAIAAQEANTVQGKIKRLLVGADDAASAKAGAGAGAGLSKKQLQAEEQASRSRAAGFAASLEEMEDVALAFKDQKPRLKQAMTKAKGTAQVLDQIKNKGSANAAHDAVLQSTAAITGAGMGMGMHK